MIKVTLTNGVVVEGDSADEVSMMIDQLFADPTADKVEIEFLPPSHFPPPIRGIPVSISQKLFEVYDVITLFPQGISTRNITNLLAIKHSTTTSRVHELMKKGAIERVPHKELWTVSDNVRNGNHFVICPGQSQ